MPLYLQMKIATHGDDSGKVKTSSDFTYARPPETRNGWYIVFMIYMYRCYTRFAFLRLEHFECHD